MKYRIKLVRYASEREEFQVEKKGLFGWSLAYNRWGIDEGVPMVFDNFEDAKKYIFEQIANAEDKRIVSTEIVFELEDK